MTPLSWPYAIDGHVLSINGPLRTPMDPEVRQSFLALLHCGQRRIVLDLSRVSDIDAAGIGELVRAYNMAHAANGTMQVINTTRWVRELIERVGLDTLLLADPARYSLAD